MPTDEFTGAHTPAGALNGASDALARRVGESGDGLGGRAFGLAGFNDAYGEGMGRVGLDREQGIERPSSVSVRREDL